MCEIFRTFCKTTNLISSTYYPTSNEYFMQVWKIKWLLWETLKSDDALM